MKSNRIKCGLFLISLLLLVSQQVYAQCSFSVDVIQQKESDCQANGVVKATLQGAGVSNGNIQLHDAQYSIASTSGGYSASFSTNGGILQNVPPGTYTVTARAYCSVTGAWLTAESGKVTITGSYTVPDLNKIYIVTANIQKSLKCTASGSIPIKIEGGKPPYLLTITDAPASYTAATTFSDIPEGVYTVSNLPAGNYVFRLRDDCTYSMPLAATVGEITPAFSLGAITPTHTCVNEGSIAVNVNNGLQPYSITITNAPPSYTVPQTYTQATHGTYTIDNLPAGNYTIEVKDDCGYTQTFNPTVDKITPQATSINISQTIACNASGSFDIDIQNGMPPYAITLTAPAAYGGATSFTQNHSGIFSLTDLPAGDYSFNIKDDCDYNFTGTATISVDKPKISGINSSQSESCNATGAISFDIKGGQAPYKIDVTNAPATYDQALTFDDVAKGTFSINGLNAGVYEFEVTDKCGEPIPITIEVKAIELQLDLSFIGLSFQCLPTGSLSINVNGGTKPYKITIAEAPAAYTPVPNIFIMNEPCTFLLDNLYEGAYKIIVEDACGLKDSIDVDKAKIKIFTQDIPEDPFLRYFYLPASSDMNCKNVRIWRNNNDNTDMDVYWNPNSYAYYEVSFLFNGIGTPAWQPLTEYIDYTLPETYKQVRDNKSFVLATVRLQGDDTRCALYVNDTIWLNTVESIVDAPHSPSCDGFTFSFKQNTNDKGILCYPYSWELRDSLGVVVKQGSAVNTSNTQTVTNVLPFGKLTLHFKDSEGYEWVADTIKYYWKNNSVADISYHNFGCDQYTINFNNLAICYPYSWELRKPDNSIVTDAKGITTADLQEVVELDYNINYRLFFIDNNKDTSVYTITQDKQHLSNYSVTSEAATCFPDLGKGYIKIYRNGVNSVFTKGTRLRYVSGPSVPAKHADITLDDTQTDLTALYPFSTDSIIDPQIMDIKQGVYQFEIIDTCDVIHPIQINYEAYSQTKFTYIKRETCSGTQIYPIGEILLGTTPQPIYFRIRSFPTDIAVDQTSITTGGMIFLREPGEYVIQMSLDDQTKSCPIDTFVIQYSKRSVKLDKDATKAYICDEDSPGYIYVQAIGGVGPYSYDLIDNGNEITSDNGEFIYGVAGASYDIRINDHGCDVSFEQGINMIDLSKERLIYGTNDVCIGSKIQLNCVPISSTYNWVGPFGFTSDKSNPAIDVATLDNNGTYTVTIQPKGCLKTIQQDIEITVHQPEMPDGEGVNVQCLNAPTEPLTAIILPNHHAQWYDKDGTTPLPHAPSPATSKVDTVTYYLIQISDDMGCRSEKKAIKSIISDLPDNITKTKAPDICPGVVPIIIIPQTIADYTYDLYTNNVGGQLMGSGIGSGDTLKIQGKATLTNSTTYYVEVLNNYQCRALERIPTTIEVVDYVYIKPDKIPSFQREKLYSVQLQTNAAAPYEFTALESLPLGFQLSPSGEITGTAPRNGKINPTPFTVKVVDNDGCVAIKQYELTSGIFVPQAFTPNGDGSNDHFMKGKRLVILDRLGIKIFEGDDGWDGTRNGQPAPADTYFYIIYYIDDDGTKSNTTGYITLLRHKS